MYVSLKSKTHMHALRTVLIQSHDELTHTCFSSVVVSWCGCGGVVVCPKTRRVFDGIEEGRATYVHDHRDCIDGVIVLFCVIVLTVIVRSGGPRSQDAMRAFVIHGTKGDNRLRRLGLASLSFLYT
jgi:hypothetical protein